jgi:hypothetical protein
MYGREGYDWWCLARDKVKLTPRDALDAGGR